MIASINNEEELDSSALDIDFLDTDFLVDILAQLNKQLALQMRNEFDKGKDKKKTGEGRHREVVRALEDAIARKSVEANENP